MEDRISVVVVEDSLLVRDSVVRSLASLPQFEVVGVAEEYHSAVALIDQLRPAVVLTDVRMPPTSTDEGIRLAHWLSDSHPGIGVIVLSNYADPAYTAGLLAGDSAGRGYLLKERVAHFGQLADAVREVAAGRTVLDPDVVAMLLARPRADDRLARLTPREREVLGELATGSSNRTIADRLVLTRRAVEKHINAIFAKLDLTLDAAVDRRVKAVLMFLDDRAAG